MIAITFHSLPQLNPDGKVNVRSRDFTQKETVAKTDGNGGHKELPWAGAR